MARAKQTNRAEARKRYRQATQPIDAEGDEVLDQAPSSSSQARPAPAKVAPAAGPQRPGIFAAFRGAYRPAQPREDFKALPGLVTHWSFLVAVALVLAGTVAVFLYPNYTGGQTAFQLLVLPGSALAPQLVAGFFAKRGSYILGFFIGALQVGALAALLPTLASAAGAQVPPEGINNLLTSSLLSGPIGGALFSAAAAWYRRFLSLSSPRRVQPGRPGAKPAPKRAATRR